MKTVLIHVVSNSLGDTIASVPYVSEYQKKHNIVVYCSVFDPLIFMFIESYPNITFVGREYLNNYDEVIEIDYIFSDSIQRGYASQLGFENAPYIRPNISIGEFQRPIKNKYVVLGVHSTSQMKYWNHPSGVKSQPEAKNWNDLCSILRKRGFTPVTLEKYENFGVSPFFNGVPSKSNKQIGKSLLDALNIVKHSEFYIGLSSGMSWVAHGLGKKVAMISNFTQDWNEFDLSLEDYIRITNKNVCHGCWNNPGVLFDKGDWYCCPLHKNTDRQFECHTSISVDDVVKQIEKWL